MRNQGDDDEEEVNIPSDGGEGKEDWEDEEEEGE